MAVDFSRRRLLQGSAISLGALATGKDAFAGLLSRVGSRVPWYRQAQKTTYNYCDMCPWRCGIIVRSVNGRVVKIDGNPKDPKSRGRLCARGQAGSLTSRPT